jgi:hypothetical protein
MRHHYNTSNYTSNTRSDKNDVGLYPSRGRTWVNPHVLLFLSKAIESASAHALSMNRKPLNMGISGVEPRHHLPHYQFDPTISFMTGEVWLTPDKIA